MSDAANRRRERVRGCLLGAALGSALGLPLEGVPLSKRPPEAGSTLLTHDGVTGALSADAQLILFTAEGLIRAGVRYASKGICHPPGVVLHAYLRWLATQGIPSAREPLHCLDTGWLYGVKALHRRRGAGKGTIEALQRGELFTSARPPNQSKGNGALVGAVLGVTGGEQVLPTDWIAALELRQEIETLADDLSRAPTENLDDGDWWARYPGC